MSNKNKAVVLLSGGQDSATCLMWALEKFGEKNVSAVSFDYGQKHAVELRYAKNLAKNFELLNYRVFNMQGLLGGSSLTDHDQDMSGSHAVNSSLPSSFTAGRNALFLTVAASWAYTNGISNIVTGVCQTDYSGYPDCRMVFIRSMEQALYFALDSEMTIHAPLMNLTKAETWKLAKECGDKLFLDVDPIEIIVLDTITDYNGDETINYWGRGKLDNPASVLRKKGYDEAKKLGYI